MNHRITISGLICIFLCAAFLSKAQEYSLKTADSLFAAGKDSAALIHYEGCCFYSNNNEAKTLALCSKAMVYKNNHNFLKAITTLQRINCYGLNDSLVYAVNYELAVNSFLAGKFIETESYIKLLKSSKQIYNQELVLFLEILLSNEMNNWDKALSLSHELIQKTENPSKSDSLISEINLLYGKKNLPRLKKEKTAVLLSRIIPGLGQIYAGYPAEGVFNFLIHAASLGFGIQQICTGFYATGYFIGTSIFSKFYLGAPTRVRFLVQKTNYRRIRKFNDKVKYLLINNPDNYRLAD